MLQKSRAEEIHHEAWKLTFLSHGQKQQADLLGQETEGISRPRVQVVIGNA